MASVLTYLRVTAIFICLLLLSFSCESHSNEADEPVDNQPVDSLETSFDSDYSLLASDSYVQDRIFYLLSLVNEIDEIKAAIEDNAQIKADYNSLLANLQGLSNTASVSTIASNFILSDDEIIEQAELMKNILVDSAKLDLLVENHILPSGCYIKYEQQTAERLLYLSWKEVLNGLNTIFEQYLLGENPVDTKSDGPKYDVVSTEYRTLINSALADVLNNDYTSTFNLSLSFALCILDVNDRGEAGAFEPLDDNNLALSKMQTINWDNFSYSVLLLLGDSPNSSGDAENISDGAIQRIAYAVESYNAQLAPFIMISGANLYPKFTTYYEAVEMKKYMLQHYDIPEEAIIIEPHARHTYTNLRNASRLIFRYDIPYNKTGLIVSSSGHLDLIENNAFKTDCYNALGYMPATIGDRISKYNLEFLPNVTSLHIDTRDPLDP